ncbi:MAG: hypothetical protein AABY83_15255 [Pseudomonadota bacterium]
MVYNRRGPPMGGGLGLMMLVALYSVFGLLIGLACSVVGLLLAAFSPLRWGIVSVLLLVAGIIVMVNSGGLDLPLETNRALGAELVRHFFTHHSVRREVVAAAAWAGIGVGLVVGGAVLAALGASTDAARAKRAAGSAAPKRW